MLIVVPGFRTFGLRLMKYRFTTVMLPLIISLLIMKLVRQNKAGSYEDYKSSILLKFLVCKASQITWPIGLFGYKILDIVNGPK